MKIDFDVVQPAASYFLTHLGRVVRTIRSRQLSRQSIMNLCKVIDVEGRLVGGEELELVGGLGRASVSTLTTASEVKVRH